jgi:recombinational DNA repair protein (RecF pathway)
MKNPALAKSRFKIADFSKQIKKCSHCGEKGDLGDYVYLSRLGICADCLNRKIWNEEKKIFAGFISAKGDFGLNK